jgi:hypothetical protein
MILIVISISIPLLAAPPLITSSLSNVTNLTGEEVRMVCKAEGSPQPWVEWRKNNQQVGDAFGHTEAVACILAWHRMQWAQI